MRTLLLLALIGSCGARDSEPPRPISGPIREDGAVTRTLDPEATMPLTLRAKFELAGPGVLHAASPADLEADGPFLGSDMGPEDYDFLDGQLVAMAQTGSLFACLELEDGLFILRGPGAGDPTDLFLAQWEGSARMLTWIADLAYDHCGSDECGGQQSWLEDLDGDGRRDIVQRSWRQDMDTGEDENRLEAWLVGRDGELTATQLDAGQRARYRQ